MKRWSRWQSVAVIYVLTVAGCPQPVPPPPPEPVAYLFLIHESAHATPETADVLNATEWKDAAETRGIKWKVADHDNAELLLPSVVQAARALGLPAVVWADKTRSVVAVQPMPLTPELMLELVQERQ